MFENKDSDKSKGWFPNLNHLLLVLLVGTIFVSQTPFHQSRPAKPETTAPGRVLVDARSWQDPFEAVDKHIEKHKEEAKKDIGLETLQDEIISKISSNALKKLNVVAVMVPGDPYFEDSESRRKLRYAVLSGLDAAVRYMPENPSHIEYFQINETAAEKKAQNQTENAQEVKHRVAYEWMVYKPIDYNEAPKGNERPYQRPPVLVLWLNDSEFTATPHEKLKRLINTVFSERPDAIGTIDILGPFGSDNLQDFVNEVLERTPQRNDDRFSYYSPSATLQDTNLLKNFHTGSLQSADLHRYFLEHGISFLRVTLTDQDAAVAIKSELKIRGIEPSSKHRVLLLGEWDTLYGWHLPNTYAAEMLKGIHNNCKGPSGELQNWDVIYDVKEQCIFRFSYLRGLDGEKKKDKETNDVKSSTADKDIGQARGESIKLEGADGDSQYDYVRRLVAQIAELDGELREEGDPAHTFAAIGVLGSDVYDKLLILEALHDRFPDAVFFTNDMDARLLQPEFNHWARNLIVASGFGLKLDRHLQRDIPPLRDSIQTAYFLSTQLALAKSITSEFIFDEHLKQFAGLSQIKLNELLSQPRIFELGRTRAFDLSDGPANCGENTPCIQPVPDKTAWITSWPGAVVWLAVISSILLFPAAVRRFLQTSTGLWFIILNLGLLYMLFICSHLQLSEGIEETLLYFVTGFAYCGIVIRIAVIENSRRLKSWILPLNLGFIVFALLILWHFVRPQGWLDVQEPYALLEGVSMWPSEGIRWLALVLTGYFIIDVCRFPKRFDDWLAVHFQLRGFCEAKTSAEWRQTQLPILRRKNYILLNEWLDWKNSTNRWFLPLIYAVLFYLVANCVFLYLGPTHLPFRGENIRSLDNLLSRGLLVPAFIFLLFLVIDVVKMTIDLVERCFPEGTSKKQVTWPANTLWKYASSFKITDRNDMLEWVGMRFIVGLNSQIYALIGYPLIIALLMVLARSSYFDNWNVSVALKLVIGSSMVILIYWDRRLNKAADKSRNNALKSLREKSIRHNGDTQGERFDRLITMVESYDEDFYKSFSQRPIFRNSLLIGLALLADSVDYTLLASKLL